MDNFFSIDVIRSRLSRTLPYAEFLCIPAMSCGVYVLQTGAEDPQRPHHEDEIYYVRKGAARMKITPANQPPRDQAISAGDVIFVAAGDEHRFHSITAELVLLVVFAPAHVIEPR